MAIERITVSACVWASPVLANSPRHVEEVSPGALPKDLLSYQRGKDFVQGAKVVYEVKIKQQR